MSAIAALTIADGKATPVTRTFAPVNIDSQGVARFADRSGGIAIGFPMISQSLRAPANGAKNYRLTVKVVVPVLEQTSPSTATGIQPAPTKAYDMAFTGEFIMPERSVLADRKDLLAFVKNYLANAVVTAAVNDFESIY